MMLRSARYGLLVAVAPLLLASCADSPGSSNAGSTGQSTASDSTAANGGNGKATSAAGKTTPCPPADGSAAKKQQFDAPFAMCIDPAKTYTATITTDAGDVVVAFDAKKAPNTVNNFVSLARSKFYEGVSFHRVSKDFMIQGGDPQGNGTGGPGYQFADELPTIDPATQTAYKVGSMAMANAGPDTNGSQFFIVTGDKGVKLPPNYSLFGQVTSGMEAVKKIESDSQDETPTVLHKITKVAIAEK